MACVLGISYCKKPLNEQTEDQKEALQRLVQEEMELAETCETGEASPPEAVLTPPKRCCHRITPIWGILICSLTGGMRQVLMPIALTSTTVANAGLIQPSIPVVTTLMSMVTGLESFSYGSSFAAVGCFIGLAVTGQVWDIAAVDTGFWYLLLIPVLKALQLNAVHVALVDYSMTTVQIGQAVGMILFVLPLSYILELGTVCKWNNQNFVMNVASLSKTAWACVFGSSVLMIMVSWRIQIAGTKRLGPNGTSFMLALQSVLAMLFGWLVLGEELTFHGIGGAGIVTGSLALHQWDTQRRKARL
eukprot:GHVO01047625.1.p1 GENE.GHVO01047625.1~~GHVO01047625.1.p1  ORF type:complete len:303 (+),score=51.30 GHVO01047625.1:119-1027(+)